MKIIQGVKVITAKRHHNAAYLREQTNKESKPTQQEKAYEENYEGIGALLNQIQNTGGKERSV